jgi:hypothetical protein
VLFSEFRSSDLKPAFGKNHLALKKIMPLSMGSTHQLVRSGGIERSSAGSEKCPSIKVALKRSASALA